MNNADYSYDNNMNNQNMSNVGNNSNNKGGKVLLLIILIVGLVVGSFFLGKYIEKNNNKKTTDNNDKKIVNDMENDSVKNNESNNNQSEQSTVQKQYKEYKQGDEVILSDNKKYLVVSNSNSSQDYVTLMALDILEITSDKYDKISNDYFASNGKVTYDKSSVKEFVEANKSKYPVTYKNVDGYEIRLIKVDELLSFDKGWVKQENNDSYEIEMSDSSLLKKVPYSELMTMTETKCTTGRCASLYSFTFPYGPETNTRYIDHVGSGVSNLYPVLNVLKDSIK